MSMSLEERPRPERPSYQEVFKLGWAHVCRAVLGRGVRPEDCDDAAQDVFVIVYQRLDEYEDRGRLLAWLSGIASRVALEYHRKHRGDGDVFDNEADGTGVPAPMPSGERGLVLLALESVEAERRELLLLHHVDGIAVPEIARTLGIPLKTVEWRLAKARQEFSEAWDRLHRRIRRETGAATVVPLHGPLALLAVFKEAPVPDADLAWQRLQRRLGGGGPGGGGSGPAAPAVAPGAPLAAPAPVGAISRAQASIACLAALVVLEMGILIGALWDPFHRSFSAPPEARPEPVTLAPNMAPAPSIAPAPPVPLVPSASSASSPTAPPGATLSREHEPEHVLLDRMHRELRQRHFDLALRACEEHARAFPRGKQGATREAGCIAALLGAGRRVEARARMERFVATYPSDPQATALRAQMSEAP